MGRFGATAAWLMVPMLFGAGTALAQSAAPEAPTGATEAPTIGATLQEITVSASAISIAGYDQPTPVTSLGLQQIESAAQPDLSDTIRQMPAFGGSSSPQNSTF